MDRFSTHVSVFALASAIAVLSLPRANPAPPTAIALTRPDFSAAGIDPMPVGTAGQIKRMRRARAERKA